MFCRVYTVFFWGSITIIQFCKPYWYNAVNYNIISVISIQDIYSNPWSNFYLLYVLFSLNSGSLTKSLLTYSSKLVVRNDWRYRNCSAILQTKHFSNLQFQPLCRISLKWSVHTYCQLELVGLKARPSHKTCFF